MTLLASSSSGKRSHLMQLIEEESKKSSSKRSFATNCITELFVLEEERICLKLTDPLFTEAPTRLMELYQKSA